MLKTVSNHKSNLGTIQIFKDCLEESWIWLFIADRTGGIHRLEVMRDIQPFNNFRQPGSICQSPVEIPSYIHSYYNPACRESVERRSFFLHSPNSGRCFLR